MPGVFNNSKEARNFGLGLFVAAIVCIPWWIFVGWAIWKVFIK